MLLHVHAPVPSLKGLNHGSLFFFTHDGRLEHEPIPLVSSVAHYLADDTRLWAIDATARKIISHAQPKCTGEIIRVIAQQDPFVSFDSKSNFIPIRLAVNHRSLAILGKDLRRIFIYDKITRERTFSSSFSALPQRSISKMGLFADEASLLLKFDWLTDANIKQSMFIHVDRQQRSIGRIEGKHCRDVAIGPHGEILVGYDLSNGVVRCHM